MGKNTTWGQGQTCQSLGGGKEGDGKMEGSVGTDMELRD